MKLDSLEDLSKLLDLCNKKGVESISVDNISLKLKDNFQPKKRIRNVKDELTDDVMPEEAALFWSSQPITGE